MKCRVQRVVPKFVPVAPGPRRQPFGDKSGRRFDGGPGLGGETSDKRDAAGSAPAPLVPTSASITFGSVPAALGSFSALELERIIPVPQAANINNQHEDTFRRNFPHLIRKIGKRKTGVKLRDAITLPPARA
jgi:hypothetical protein